jgi:hypothetical protein
MKRNYVTFFDKNYLAKGLTLIRSLEAQDKNNWQIYIVCMDEITRLCLERLSTKKIICIPYYELFKADKELVACKDNRTYTEFMWTCTPAIILHCLKKFNLDSICYLDADLYFFSNPDPIFIEFDNYAVGIHEHRFHHSMQHLNEYGVYNVGLVYFNKKGIDVLSIWRDACITWCYARKEDGKFGDQGYLNNWPKDYDNVHVIKNIGAGVAPWNHYNYSFTLGGDGRVLVDATPLIFYHFHALKMLSLESGICHNVTDYPGREDVYYYCFSEYFSELVKSYKIIDTILPNSNLGLSNDVVVRDEHTVFSKTSLKLLSPKKQFSNTRFAWNCTLGKNIEKSTTY